MPFWSFPAASEKKKAFYPYIMGIGEKEDGVPASHGNKAGVAVFQAGTQQPSCWLPCWIFCPSKDLLIKPTERGIMRPLCQ
jgi:hypothetical protein